MEKPILLQDLGRSYPTHNSKHKTRYGLYKCFCGNEFKASTQHIKSGHTTSCGCYGRTKCISHGLSRSRLYRIWNNMLQRCTNKKHDKYKYYGQIGITVCSKWFEFTNFYEDMKDGYQDNLTIDRINPNGNYEKSNCRWTTRAVQSRNTRLIHKHNTSGYKGASWNTQKRKWKAQIVVNNKRFHIGYYNNVVEAAQAYDNYIILNNLEHTINFIGVNNA